MPILLKKIDGSIISLFGNNDADFRGDVVLIKSVVGEFGSEDYIKLTAFEAFTQKFGSNVNGDYCEITPVLLGPNTCSNYTELTITI